MDSYRQRDFVWAIHLLLGWLPGTPSGCYNVTHETTLFLTWNVTTGGWKRTCGRKACENPRGWRHRAPSSPTYRSAAGGRGSPRDDDYGSLSMARRRPKSRHPSLD